MKYRLTIIYKSAVQSFIKSNPASQSRNNSCLTQVDTEEN